MTQEWKPVVGYEGRYEVASNGEIRSIFDQFGRVRKEPLMLAKTKRGHPPSNFYWAVNLYKNGKASPKANHRAVAEAFLDNPNNLPLVNHKDEDTFNNDVMNLEWCTHQYNQEYSLSKKLYRFITPNGDVVEIKNLRKFCRENGLNHAHMYQVAQNKLISYKKYKFHSHCLTS